MAREGPTVGATDQGRRSPPVPQRSVRCVALTERTSASNEHRSSRAAPAHTAPRIVVEATAGRSPSTRDRAPPCCVSPPQCDPRSRRACRRAPPKPSAAHSQAWPVHHVPRGGHGEQLGLGGPPPEAWASRSGARDGPPHSTRELGVERCTVFAESHVAGRLHGAGVLSSPGFRPPQQGGTVAARCYACGAAISPTARFCSECGTATARTCPACGAAVSGRFCSECGTPLTATAVAPAPSLDGVGAAPVAERRITSVLFGDLVGFTPLSESRDAEDVRELLSKYFDTARNLIERFGGVVEKFIGDAVMAVWGVPTAHEDDSERAVRAGLDLVDAVSQLGDEIGVPGLAMRIGIVTGEVAVTLGAAGQGMVAGDAVNTAARVQAVAGPGEVWVDETTRAATAAAVAYDDVGMHELKGKSESVRLFAARTVVAAIGGARRVDGLEAPFAGRDREIRLAKEPFHATLEENRPRLVAVFGPAGVGKSRFGWEFDKYIDGISDTVHWHRGRCLSYGEGVAFWALAEIVRGRLGILEGDPTEIVVQRLIGGLELHVADSDERSWLLPRMATLIGVGDAVSPGTSFGRDDLFAAWRTFFERIARSDGSVAA